MTNGSAKIKNFRDLEVWKLGMSIVTEVYAATAKFPKEELYGLVAQLRRAAVSIPSNVAEGFNRYHNTDYRRFLHVALGSCAEVETQLEVAFELGYLNREARDQLLEKLDHETRMLRNLIKRLNQREK